ncbi:MAG TPA: cobalamin-dependent protein, partial [Kofleriaceae bacterium]|nr:cobalamin-dependent protein [Kofleriaceae bacterium]
MGKRIYFTGFSHPALDYLPLTWGLLRAHAEQHEVVRASYVFERPMFRREAPDVLLSRIREPFMLAVSCYVWNFQHTIALCRAVKEAHPECIIVAGGPDVPERPQGYFERHPYFDVLVHGEGEIPFTQLLLQYLEETPDLRKVPGITFNEGGREVTNEPSPKLPKEIDVPSPFLQGYFDDCLDEARMKSGELNVLWETNRGCPYGCTFCDWGSATMNKLRQFPIERLRGEIEWFSKHRVDLLNLADANFGLIERDLELTRTLVAAKAATGYPAQFRTNFAKNSNERVFEISRLLHDAQMFTGTTLSMQSTSAPVLAAIKRQSIGI